MPKLFSKFLESWEAKKKARRIAGVILLLVAAVDWWIVIEDGASPARVITGVLAAVAAALELLAPRRRRLLRWRRTATLAADNRLAALCKGGFDTMGLFGQALCELHHSHEPEAFFVCDEQEECQLDLHFYLAPQPDSLEAALLTRVVGRCLDIGCGAGRILRYLSAKGYEVVGIDIDPRLIELCREFGESPVRVASWEEMEPLGQFDSLLLLNRSIGIGGDLAGVRRLLARCAASASRSGILLFDSYEVAGRTGVSERTLRYKYRGQYGEPFPWIHLRYEIANQLLAETGWLSDTVIREGDRYGVVARKS